MASTYVRDCFDPRAVNSPLMMICTASVFFNSVKNGVFRPVNMFTNISLVIILSLSNGLYLRGDNAEWGAKLGIAGSVLFTGAPKMKMLYTQRLFPWWVHYGIGLGYIGYHSSLLYQSQHYYEDAGEDEADE